jgi:hypothetical protein
MDLGIKTFHVMDRGYEEYSVSQDMHPSSTPLLHCFPSVPLEHPRLLLPR